MAASGAVLRTTADVPSSRRTAQVHLGPTPPAPTDTLVRAATSGLPEPPAAPPPPPPPPPPADDAGSGPAGGGADPPPTDPLDTSGEPDTNGQGEGRRHLRQATPGGGSDGGSVRGQPPGGWLRLRQASITGAACVAANATWGGAGAT